MGNLGSRKRSGKVGKKWNKVFGTYEAPAKCLRAPASVCERLFWTFFGLFWLIPVVRKIPDGSRLNHDCGWDYPKYWISFSIGKRFSLARNGIWLWLIQMSYGYIPLYEPLPYEIL